MLPSRGITPNEPMYLLLIDTLRRYNLPKEALDIVLHKCFSICINNDGGEDSDRSIDINKDISIKSINRDNRSKKIHKKSIENKLYLRYLSIHLSPSNSIYLYIYLSP
jgi:hypothetical protein